VLVRELQRRPVRHLLVRRLHLRHLHPRGVTTSTSRPLAGRRTTRQRTAVVELLQRTDGFRTAQQLHDALKTDGESIGLTTVYRTLQVLAESGDVDVVRSAEGEALYRRCADTTHHHHLVCRGCGATIEVDGPEMEVWADNIAAQHGFSDIEHVVEIFGTCARCGARASLAAPHS
jgi:Fur family ferric uptake transcriptional regulator